MTDIPQVLVVRLFSTSAWLPILDNVMQVAEQETVSLQNVPARKPTLPQCQHSLRESPEILLSRRQSKTLRTPSKVNSTTFPTDVESAEIGLGIA